MAVSFVRLLCLASLACAIFTSTAAEGVEISGDFDEPDLAKLGESLSLGESQEAPVQVAPNQLAAQNMQLQGAIAAIEGGTPPPGMEAMMGGGASAPAAAAASGGGGGDSAAISKGIKMAMSSVKPLMDKYVATARALTDKYTKIQAQYKKVKAEAEACATEEQTKARIDVAVKTAVDAANARAETEITKLKAYIEKLKEGDAGAVERLTAKVASMQAFEKQAQIDFRVQLNLAKTKAQSNMDLLHDQLRTMILDQLDNRNKMLDLQKEKSAKAKRGQKAADELKTKKEASSREAEAGVKRAAAEKIEKKEEAQELQTKTDAAEEVKTLNRDTVMRKARKAMNAARHAARMARTVVRDTARSLDDARLDDAKSHAVDDVKALAKLRHHQDLAIQTVDSAAEKQQKVARYEFTAKHSLHDARVRADVTKRKNRFEDRRTRTLKRLAAKAADKAELLAAEARDQAKLNNIPVPGLLVAKDSEQEVGKIAELKAEVAEEKAKVKNAEAEVENVEKAQEQTTETKGAQAQTEQKTEEEGGNKEATSAEEGGKGANKEEEPSAEEGGKEGKGGNKEEEPSAEEGGKGANKEEEPSAEEGGKGGKEGNKGEEPSAEEGGKGGKGANKEEEPSEPEGGKGGKGANKEEETSAQEGGKGGKGANKEEEPSEPEGGKGGKGANKEEETSAQEGGKGGKGANKEEEKEAEIAQLKTEVAEEKAKAKNAEEDAEKAKEETKEAQAQTEQTSEEEGGKGGKGGKGGNKEEENSDDGADKAPIEEKLSGKSANAIQADAEKKTGMEPPGTETGSGPNVAEREKIRKKTADLNKDISAKIKEAVKEVQDVDNGKYSAPTKSPPSDEAHKAEVQKEMEAILIKPGDSAKTKKVKMQAAASAAMLKTDLASIKTKKAKKLRKLARKKLNEQGSPIPENLKRGEMKKLEEKLEKARNLARVALQSAVRRQNEGGKEAGNEEESSKEEEGKGADTDARWAKKQKSEEEGGKGGKGGKGGNSEVGESVDLEGAGKAADDVIDAAASISATAAAVLR